MACYYCLELVLGLETWGVLLRDTQKDCFKWDFDNAGDKMPEIFNLHPTYLFLTLNLHSVKQWLNDSSWRKMQQIIRKNNTTQCKADRVWSVPFKNEKKSLFKRARIFCYVCNTQATIVSKTMFQLVMIYFLLLHTFFFHDCCAMSCNCTLKIIQPDFESVALLQLPTRGENDIVRPCSMFFFSLRSFLNEWFWPWKGCLWNEVKERSSHS